MSSIAAAKTEVKSPKVTKLSSILFRSGLVILAVGFLLAALIFGPIAGAEIKYFFRGPDKNTVVSTKPVPGQNVIIPQDTNFGLVIPKIGANAKVIPNVDPYNSREYQVALTKGVAHARGSVFPGLVGNVFIFAHSAEDFYEANQYNAIFYLLSKMEKGDQIVFFYKQNKYTYLVTDKKIVPAASVNYLLSENKEKTVTLMTCWPAGTTWQRLIVLGKLSQT